MITGEIKVHEEPTKTYYGTSWPGDDDYDYQGYNWYKSTNKFTSRPEREDKLKLMKPDLESRGFKEGARVKRTTGFGGKGTITEISIDPFNAYNFNLDEYNPIKVKFDDTNYNTYFAEDDLELIKGEENGS